jgi:hypothetical protein
MNRLKRSCLPCISSNISLRRQSCYSMISVSKSVSVGRHFRQTVYHASHGVNPLKQFGEFDLRLACIIRRHIVRQR